MDIDTKKVLINIAEILTLIASNGNVYSGELCNKIENFIKTLNETYPTQKKEE